MVPKQKATGVSGSNASAPTPLTVLTVNDVASRLQISKAAVYELTRFRQASDTPRLPARKIGRSLRFIASEIDGWMLALPQHAHLQKRHYIKKDVLSIVFGTGSENRIQKRR